MKKILFTSIFAGCAAIGLSSCMNGDYDANPAGSLSGKNPLKTERISSGVHPGAPAYYSWPGSDPVSARINGVSFQATSATASETAGKIVVNGVSGASTVQISFARETPANTVLLITPGVNTAEGAIAEGNTVFITASGSSGGIYVMENDAAHCAGKFFMKVTDPRSGDTRDVTEGYFNVVK